MDSNLKELYEKLKPRVDKTKRYSKISNVVDSLILLSVLGILTSPNLVQPYLDIDLPIFLFAELILWIIFIIVAYDILGKKFRKYSLTTDEWTIYYACSILKNLEQYTETSNQELKKEHQKKAIEDARNLLLTVINRWKVGDFNLARKVFKGSISKFRNNLWTRLIPNLERLKEENLEKIDNVVYNIAGVLLPPSNLDGLIHLNDSTFQQLDEYPPSKEKIPSKLSRYLQVHGILRHTLVTLIIGAISFFIYYLGTNYLGISRDACFATAIGFLGIVIVGYWTYIKKESPKTPKE